ncbi:hypothetical protein [Actinomyces bowdenii]|uniref:Cell surface protein n=1 Tax=Actinomyces bowdenii TaxID=131109 RepID=A0A853EJQ0_9ACTO|nr:hypothetical protein [Actinomyces bowdenii]MBF0697404.1 hypothetical protein [Actinomyces bowdenii]MDO5064274.1 hypothetical protein [Actinomyces bowdenii]NYS69577.1 hypothetical protein [Actinomyces bowdenii]
MLAVATALPLVAAALLAPATTPSARAAEEAAPANPEALPTVQIDGIVWDQEVVGNTVYAVGQFNNARPAGSPAGQNEVPRSNALAYDITTGELKDWAPTTDGAINAIEASADGSVLYLGGRFNTLNGEKTWRVGAVGAADGKKQAFNVATNSSVMDLEISPDGSTLYMGGSFTQVNKSARQRAAAVNLADQTLTDFAPEVADFMVRSITVAADNSAVAIGGSFTSVEGSSDPGYGLAILEPNGSLRRNNINAVVRNADRNAGIMSLKSDANGLYGVAYSQSRSEGNVEGMFRLNWSTGDLDLLADCHGDSYDVHPTTSFVYIASHTHDCSNIGGFGDVPDRYYHGVAFTNKATGTVRRNRVWGYYNHQGQPAPTVMENFLPNFQLGSVTGLAQATWTVEGNDQYIVYGGEFTAVNGTPQQGLVRFSTSGNQADPKGEEPKDDEPRDDDDGWDGWGWGWGW